MAALAHSRPRHWDSRPGGKRKNVIFASFISMANRREMVAPLNKSEVSKHSGGVAAYLQGGFHFEEFDDVFVAGHSVLITQRNQFAAIILLE